MTTDRIATVFGGTGFLGSRIVSALARNGWTVRVAARHPDRVRDADGILAIGADVHEDASVAPAVGGADAVVNAVSLYVEKRGGAPSFRSVHVDGAERVARLSANAGVKRLFHVSGIGADKDSPSRFVRARADGEEAVRRTFSDATILRPSVMFGNGDSFFNSLADVVRRSPIVPLIGGNSRLQPVYADDVARLVHHMLRHAQRTGETVELGGPDIVTMRSIVEWLCRLLNRRRLLVPVPFPLARLQARLLEHLPEPPLTSDQVELLRNDNVAHGESGFDAIGRAPSSFFDIVPGYIGPG